MSIPYVRMTAPGFLSPPMVVWPNGEQIPLTRYTKLSEGGQIYILSQGVKYLLLGPNDPAPSNEIKSEPAPVPVAAPIIMQPAKVPPPPIVNQATGTTYIPVSVTRPEPQVAIQATKVVQDVVQARSAWHRSVPIDDRRAQAQSQAQTQAVENKVNAAEKRAQHAEQKAIQAAQLAERVATAIDQLDQIAGDKIEKLEKTLSEAQVRLTESEKVISILQQTVIEFSKRAILKKAPLFSGSAKAKKQVVTQQVSRYVPEDEENEEGN